MKLAFKSSYRVAPLKRKTRESVHIHENTHKYATNIIKLPM